jgi:uncharacterized 2Fe-2S/4Fe-4S cluster protein (DUF4445 family)
VRDSGSGLGVETVGGATPRGICGSGLVDAVAVLLERGTLKPSGRFAVPPGADGLALVPDCPQSAVFPSDVDAFQRAKAALAAAIDVLLERHAMTRGDIRRLCLCGSFGSMLDLSNAGRVGLLPMLETGRVELFAEATLGGAEMALLSPDGLDIFTKRYKLITSLNLSQVADYDDRFIAHLRLSPLRS